MNDADIFDALLEAGREPPTPCPICTGDEDAAPCSEECEAVVVQVRKDAKSLADYQTQLTKAGCDLEWPAEIAKTVQRTNYARHFRGLRFTGISIPVTTPRLNLSAPIFF